MLNDLNFPSRFACTPEGEQREQNQGPAVAVLIRYDSLAQDLGKYHYSSWVSQVKFHLDMQTRVWYLPSFKEKVKLNSY